MGAVSVDRAGGAGVDGASRPMAATRTGPTMSARRQRHPKLEYGWERRWVVQGTELQSDFDGFVVDPTSDFGRRLIPDARLLSDFARDALVCLEGPAGMGKTNTVRRTSPSATTCSPRFASCPTSRPRAISSIRDTISSGASPRRSRSRARSSISSAPHTPTPRSSASARATLDFSAISTSRSTKRSASDSRSSRRRASSRRSSSIAPSSAACASSASTRRR